jgi:hypothetical protein
MMQAAVPIDHRRNGTASAAIQNICDANAAHKASDPRSHKIAARCGYFSFYHPQINIG